MPDHVTVLGAGIVGICCGLSLLERGFQVTLVDRADPGQATSAGNAGVISPWSIVPQAMPGVWKQLPGWVLDPLGPAAIKPSYLPKLLGWGLRFLAQSTAENARRNSAAMELLNRDCVTLFRRHLAGTGREDLIRDSYYVHAFRDASAARLDGLDNNLRRDAGAELERISGEALRQLEPALSADFQAAIVIKGQARALSPGELGAVLADKFQRLGGEMQRASVRAIRPDDRGGWIYASDAGEHHSPRLVLAMGVWSAQLLAPLGVRLPLESERGYHLCFDKPGVSLQHSVLDVDRKFVASSMSDGLRVAGTAEFAGLDAPEDERRFAALARVARDTLPDLNTASASRWSGQRPSFPDSLPCIGAVEGLPGLVAAFGHSHYGLMQAPRTGQFVADIVQGQALNTDLSAFAAARFR